METDSLLAFRRSAITNGEYWRLFTGNLLHTNQWHLLMNLAGLWVLLLLFKPHFKALTFTLIFSALCLLQGLGLYLFYPGLLGYVGLSGMLHGLFTYGAIRDISTGLKSGYLLLLGVIIKVAYEQIFGASEQVTEMIGARVATEAHLIGVITGILVVALVSFTTKLKPKVNI
ncbi:rhomboid family protein [Shewanella sediminis HAW-EB3]|uniref:Rhomboid family protein n=2 Tax=Shewanella sediminis TaxID=271097 RepID=A8FUY3_SHESH|nr:rhomboid family protein [Shewanella sediminis HAW-EB3]